jgi:perosamine synthetase
MIPLAVPQLDGREWDYVKEALDSNWVSSVGPFVDRFERETARLVGSRHAIAVASGTAALHLALLLAGVEPGDEVVMPTLSFIAPANAIVYAGARPAFVDVESEYWQLDVEKASEFLSRECRRARGGHLVNRSTGARVAALLPVHVLGHPVDMNPLLELADRYDLPVVEDAAEALGASYCGQAAGSLGLIGCLSFNGNKVITTGGGGMLLTEDDELAARARYLSTQAKDDALEYVHGAVGFNYRLSNVLAAIGCGQLEQLQAKVDARRRNATAYTEAFSGVPGLAPMREAPYAASTFWLFTVRVDEERFGIDSRELLRRLASSGIQSRPLWQPLHLSKPFAGATAYRCEVAVTVEAEALSLPSSSGLSPEDRAYVIDTVLREVAR